MKKPKAYLFLLPNLFTVSSIFCGLYAILQVTDSQASDRFYRASIAILFAVLFDTFDGRVARLTKTQSAFGLQLDSLADVISFGVAPAMLSYKWALFHFGALGFLVAFVYLTCGALRLARFNVLSAKSSKSPKFFIGVSIPLAATNLASLILLHQHTREEPLGYHLFIIPVILLLSFLMVSNIRYPTFKRVRANPINIAMLLAALALVTLAAWKTSLGLMGLIISTTLILMGPVEELLRLIKRKRAIQPAHEEENNS